MNKKNKPLITVVIPSYNRIDFLINALDSVFNQTYENFEVVVINDGSSQEEYSNHKYLKNIKQIDLDLNQKKIHGFGPGNIRNFGNIESTAKYVAFLDDDDIWLPTKLEEQLKVINNKQKMVCTEAFIGDGTFNKEKNYQSYLSDFYYKKHKEIYFNSNYFGKLKNFEYPTIWNKQFIDRFLNLANPIITSSVLVEKELLDKIGWFRNLPFAADFDCWKGLLQFTDCYFINKPLVYYDNSHGSGRNYYK